jgi:DNA-binding CsgD family transcriptional regulator/tetratricopeptide (TPR) repeat protein
VEGLLERAREFRALDAAVRDAAEGSSSLVLVHGEAGIGKTSLIKAFLAAHDRQARLLVGACDDLLAPRAFGALRDVAGSGRLAAALGGESDSETVYRALLEEFAIAGVPTVLVVEDVHWADDATLDALRYVVRRLDRVRAVVVLSYRDDEVGPEHPLRKLLGGLSGVSVRRLSLRRLSAAAVEELGAVARVDASAVFAVTGGNPFFVTETLAAPSARVPATVVDAVMARVAGLADETRAALDQLSVVPSHVELWLADALLGGLDSVAEAEALGMIEVRPQGLAFRHELARRAVESCLPMSRRIELNRAVVRALLERSDVDDARVVHHAVAAGDVETVLMHGPAAAREAARAGSHRQALAHYEQVASHVDRLPTDQRAQLLDEYAWQLYAAQRYGDAVRTAHQVVDLRETLGDPVALAKSLVVLSRAAYMAEQPRLAVTTVNRAVAVVKEGTDESAQAYALAYQGGLLKLTDHPAESLRQLDAARELAERVGRHDLLALCQIYRGGALVDLGDDAGIAEIRRGLSTAISVPHYEYAARAYTNLGEDLYRLRRYDELERCVADGLEFALEHELPGHAYNLRSHDAMLRMTRGRWSEAEQILRELIESTPDAGEETRLTLPPLARLVARRGDPEAEALVEQGWSAARRGDAIQALGPAGVAAVEWAWLSGDVSKADEQVDVLLERTSATEGGLRWRGELLAYLRRAGAAVEDFRGCPPEWSTELRGDWTAAADRWAQIGDPYEQALVLAFSGDGDASVEGLQVLDSLGATAPAALVRLKMRRLGMVPRRQRVLRVADDNLARLTARQLDVLALMADGHTNAEIAARLAVSRRTVDHHVSAILLKLGVSTRREAARLARRTT